MFTLIFSGNELLAIDILSKECEMNNRYFCVVVLQESRRTVLAIIGRIWTSVKVAPIAVIFLIRIVSEYQFGGNESQRIVGIPGRLDNEKSKKLEILGQERKKASDSGRGCNASARERNRAMGIQERVTMTGVGDVRGQEASMCCKDGGKSYEFSSKDTHRRSRLTLQYGFDYSGD
jgi:hypothetical protein